MVEGFINKVKWIKRSSYGQAGFALLQRRVEARIRLLRNPQTKSGGEAPPRNLPLVRVALGLHQRLLQQHEG